ncbi:MAG: hypothetical protein AABW50_01230 [Nanoarchaeota archaeon]
MKTGKKIGLGIIAAIAINALVNLPLGLNHRKNEELLKIQSNDLESKIKTAEYFGEKFDPNKINEYSDSLHSFYGQKYFLEGDIHAENEEARQSFSNAILGFGYIAYLLK